MGGVSALGLVSLVDGIPPNSSTILLVCVVTSGVHGRLCQHWHTVCFNRKQKEETPFSLCEHRRQTVDQPLSYNGVAWHMCPPPATLCDHFCMPALALVMSDCWGTKVTAREPHSPLHTLILFPNGIVMCLFSPVNSAPLTSDHIHVPMAELDSPCTKHAS